MFRFVVFFAVIGCIYSQSPTNGGSLDDLISSIFDNSSDADQLGGITQAPVTQAPIPPVVTERPIQPTPNPIQVPTPDPLITPRPTQAPIDPINPIIPEDPNANAVNPCGEGGECIPYYLCPNGTVITDGTGILDVRLGADDDPEPERHPCAQFFQTCCFEKSEEPNIVPVEKREGCGWRNPKGIAFELKERNGESQYAEFPWTIAVMNKQDALYATINVYQCAGSLIHPSVVMTAAHCIAEKSLETLLIRAGEWDTQTKDEPFPHQDRQVAEILIHPNFQRNNLFNDIALLFLKSPVDMIENVNTICLPPPNSVFDDKRGIATGWGKDKFGRSGVYQAILKKIEMPIVGNKRCQELLRKTRLGKHFLLNESFMCAGGELGRDTCTGDGGAPLVVEIPARKDRYYEVGMVAWGIGCSEGHPGVYVNVPKFRIWIDEAFAARKLETTYYEL